MSECLACCAITQLKPCAGCSVYMCAACLYKYTKIYRFDRCPNCRRLLYDITYVRALMVDYINGASDPTELIDKIKRMINGPDQHELNEMLRTVIHVRHRRANVLSINILSFVTAVMLWIITAVTAWLSWPAFTLVIMRIVIMFVQLAAFPYYYYKPHYWICELCAVLFICVFTAVTVNPLEVILAAVADTLYTSKRYLSEAP